MSKKNLKNTEESEEDKTVVTPSNPTRMALAQCTPETFEDGDLRAYLEKFEMVAKANAWPEGISCLRLPLFLKGRASLIHRQLKLEPELSWKEVCTKFVLVFHPPEERLVWLKKFYDRVARPHEALEALADDLKRCLTFALPDSTMDQLDLLLKHQLMRSLPANLIEKLEIHQHMLSFDQLVNKARLASLEEKTVGISKVGWSEVTRNAEADDEQTPLEKRVAALELGIQRVQAGPVKCYQCGKPGHLARDCQRRNPFNFTGKSFQGNGSGSRRKW
jgi:hypothetical protein